MQEFLTADHARLDDLLTRTLTGTSAVDHAAWHQFRQGLLQHMAWEEKVAMVPLHATGGAGELCERIRVLPAVPVSVPRSGPEIEAHITRLLRARKR